MPWRRATLNDVDTFGLKEVQDVRRHRANLPIFSRRQHTIAATRRQKFDCGFAEHRSQFNGPDTTEWPVKTGRHPPQPANVVD